MSSTSFLYPATPVNVPAEVTGVSPEFRQEVKGVMGNLVLFFAVYFLMLALSVALVAASVYMGIKLVIVLSNIYGFIIGIGVIGLGVMTFFFLIKFLFRVSRRNMGDAIEVKEADQPELFAFIRQLTIDTQTQFPKKIFLTPDVNASVFYNASFLSMFLPVRKNLQIGLGLVNSLNVGEFKAVMAHEFGHFSQRSMKLGSYVYNVNRVIHNMLFENEGYGGMLRTWASGGDVFVIFARITVWIVKGIQHVLASMYEVVNKRYSSLSRQMEFHADAVAASVSGSENLVTGLRRIEFSAYSFHILQGHCETQVSEKKWTDNIYTVHSKLMLRLAAESGIPVEHNLPVISDNNETNAGSSRIVYRDQWASHPATEDRIEKLRHWAVAGPVTQEPAWSLFRDAGSLQQALTVKMYGDTLMTQGIQEISPDSFTEEIFRQGDEFNAPAAFRGVYGQRMVSLLTAEQLQALQPDQSLRFQDIFSPAHLSLVNNVSGLQKDIQVLQAIKDKQLSVSSFDFGGQKHAVADAAQIQQQLQQELEQHNQELQKLDEQTISYFMGKAFGRNGSEQPVRERFVQLNEWRKRAEQTADVINTVFGKLGPIYSGERMELEQIQQMIAGFKQEIEPAFKAELQYWKNEGAFKKGAELEKLADEFIGSDYQYFSGQSYFDTEFITLHRLSQEGFSAIQNFIVRQFIHLLEWLLQLVPENELQQQSKPDQ